MNKYLLKTKDILSTHRGGITGATIGAGIGYNYGETDVLGKKRTTFTKVMDGISGGIFGGYLGSSFDRERVYNKYFKDAKYHYEQNNTRSGQSNSGRGQGYRYGRTRTKADIYKDLNMPSDIKTKREATKHYRKEALKDIRIGEVVLRICRSLTKLGKILRDIPMALKN